MERGTAGAELPRWGMDFDRRGGEWGALRRERELRFFLQLFGAACGEFDTPFEAVFEHVDFMHGAPEIELGVSLGPDTEADGVIADGGFELGDVAEVTTVEAVGDAEDAGELPDEGAAGGFEGDEVGVVFLGEAFAMVAGDVGDDVEFIGGEAFEIAVLDEVARMLVMAAVADVPTDIVEHGGMFEEFALGGAEVGVGGEIIEDSEGELGNFKGMLFVVVAAAAEFNDAAAAGVSYLDAEANFGPVGLHVFDDHAFAEGAIADFDFVELHTVEDVIDEECAGEDLISAAGIEAGEFTAFLHGMVEQLGKDVLEIWMGHFSEEAVAGVFGAVLEEAHGDEILHGAGGADDAAYIVGFDAIEDGLAGFADVFLEGVAVFFIDGVGSDELLGEA